MAPIEARCTKVGLYWTRVLRNETNMSRTTYEISALGSVPPELFEDFGGITVTHRSAGTTIRADLADEAQFNGILDALRRGGYELLDVHKEPPPAP